MSLSEAREKGKVTHGRLVNIEYRLGNLEATVGCRHDSPVFVRVDGELTCLTKEASGMALSVKKLEDRVRELEARLSRTEPEDPARDD